MGRRASGPLQADGQGQALGEAATRAGAEPLSAKMAAVRCTGRYGQRRSQSHARDLALERAQHELEPPHVLLLELQDDNLSVLCNVGYWSKAG